ncbi:hypothetical protein [Parendozoicomonas sp. Alg238-R29]|uniref:hypothetical protein n=1 Tax=Parendozoicomonas sp. Alg238-R29 TaxID=2993446 RepID=UPI00248D40B2|nr:hypothetical protein [Parendozoicomonas sp. Alg238-R29]
MSGQSRRRDSILLSTLTVVAIIVTVIAASAVQFPPAQANLLPETVPNFYFQRSHQIVLTPSDYKTAGSLVLKKTNDNHIQVLKCFPGSGCEPVPELQHLQLQGLTFEKASRLDKHSYTKATLVLAAGLLGGYEWLGGYTLYVNNMLQMLPLVAVGGSVGIGAILMAGPVVLGGVATIGFSAYLLTSPLAMIKTVATTTQDILVWTKAALQNLPHNIYRFATLLVQDHPLIVISTIAVTAASSAFAYYYLYQLSLHQLDIDEDFGLEIKTKATLQQLHQAILQYNTVKAHHETK